MRSIVSHVPSAIVGIGIRVSRVHGDRIPLRSFAVLGLGICGGVGADPSGAESGSRVDHHQFDRAPMDCRSARAYDLSTLKANLQLMHVKRRPGI